MIGVVAGWLYTLREARTLGIGEVDGESCVDGVEERGVARTRCVEHALGKVKRRGRKRGHRRRGTDDIIHMHVVLPQ